MNIFPPLQIDGYKIDHRRQYADKTELILANYTARNTRRENSDTVVYIGGNYFSKEYLIRQWNENFFNKPIEEVLAKFSRVINNYLGPNEVGDSHIRELHELGYLPICIMSLPEGTEHKLKIPSLIIWNTHKKFFWLTNYLETILSTTLWGMCTSATTAHKFKKILNKYARMTVGNTDFVQWQGHDFSFRGMFGLEAACMSGAGHAFSFTGSDTIPVIEFLETYYNANCEKELVVGSVAATEHSVACSVILDFVNKIRIEKTNNGEVIIEDELMNLADVEYVRRLITVVYPKGIVSIVADSFDYWHTITVTARILKDDILNRDGKVVFRPDTGDPVKVVTGYNGDEIIIHNGKKYELSPDPKTGGLKGAELSESEIDGSIECLWEIFGGTITEQGYDLLDSHVGLIYGDSITLQRAEQICSRLARKRFASTNVVFGIGSYSYQYVTRDTDGYAVKATYAVIDGNPLEIYKSPKGAAFKKSAKGLTAVFKDENSEFYLKDGASWSEVMNCEFVKIFEDGKLLKDYTLSEVRENLSKYQ
jgi:nicotinamide phosphoribosyltransferase